MHHFQLDRLPAVLNSPVYSYEKRQRLLNLLNVDYCVAVDRPKLVLQDNLWPRGH